MRCLTREKRSRTSRHSQRADSGRDFDHAISAPPDVVSRRKPPARSRARLSCNVRQRMKNFRITFTLIALTLAVISRAHTKEEIESSLALICDQPGALFSPESQKALKVFTDSFPADRLMKLGLPDEAFAWVPTFGPCGGPGSPLLIAFLASAARDEMAGRKEQIIYRGWQVVLKHYAYLRKTASDDFPEIPALEEMAKKEKSGILAKEATQLEEQKAPNQSSQPTPTSRRG